MTKSQSSSRQFHFHFYLSFFLFVVVAVQCATVEDCNQSNADGYCSREDEGDDINSELPCGLYCQRPGTFKAQHKLFFSADPDYLSLYQGDNLHTCRLFNNVPYQLHAPLPGTEGAYLGGFDHKLWWARGDLIWECATKLPMSVKLNNQWTEKPVLVHLVGVRRPAVFVYDISIKIP